MSVRARRVVAWALLPLLAVWHLPTASGAEGDFAGLFGGTGFDQARVVVRDAAGDLFLAGETFSADFPTTPGAFQGSHAGTMDSFVAKVASNGSRLLIATLLGGSGRDEILSLALDDDGYVYAAGTTDSPDFPTTPGAYDGNVSSGDAFVVKFSPDLETLVYGTVLGGSSIDEALAVAVDADGSAYLAGETFSADFPTTPGAFDRSNHGGWDAFAAKINPAGSDLVYSTYLGGLFFDAGDAIALDETGAAYVAGFTGSSDFPSTPDAFQTRVAGGTDAFVVKLSPAGDAILFGTFLGGVSGEESWSLERTADGSLFLVGQTSSSSFPTTPGAFDRTYDGIGDAFIAKFDPDGRRLAYASYLGGIGADTATSIALDPAGAMYVAGFTSSEDFPTRPNAADASYGRGGDAFLVKVSPDGSGLVYATFLGGIDSDVANSVVLDESGVAVVAGRTNSTDFPATVGSFGPGYRGGGDAFLVRLSIPAESGPWTPFVIASLAAAVAVSVAFAVLLIRRRRARMRERPPPR